MENLKGSNKAESGRILYLNINICEDILPDVARVTLKRDLKDMRERANKQKRAISGYLL